MFKKTNWSSGDKVVLATEFVKERWDMFFKWLANDRE